MSVQKATNMQHGRCTTSITCYETPKISQATADDADWLQKPTFSSSDHDLPPSEFDLEPKSDTEPPDKDTAITAHLRDREHASDLDVYEWNSDDLVSEACSGGENTSDEELPRPARKDEFERGLRRDWTRSREHREQWEEPHAFYKRRIQARLETGENYERHSYVEKRAWSARAEHDWGTTEGFGGVDCVVGSKEPRTGGDGWVECMREDQEPWPRLVTPEYHDTGVTGEEGSAGTDEHSGELPLWKKSRGRGPVSRKTAYREPSNTSIIRHRHFSKSAHTSPSPFSFCDEINVTDLDALSPLPCSQLAKSALRNPKRSPGFKGPESVTPEEAIGYSNAALDEEHALNNFLDACIRKTQALLADAENALHSTPETEQVSDPDDERVSRDEEAQCLYTDSRDVPAKGDRGETLFAVSAKNSDATTPREIVRVERWWKVKGGEAWREVGGWVEENGYVPF